MITVVAFHEVAKEIAPNIARHHREMNKSDEYGVPNIDWENYLELSHAGQCVAAILRDGENLAGYSVYTIGFNPRYKHILEASSDGTFLEKEYRGRGLELLRKAHEFLFSMGVQEINYITNDETFGKLLERRGAEQSYKIWSVKNGQ